MPLKKFWFTNLGPFDEVEFELDEHVNVFTGPNNSGKSTTLMALGEILVYPFGLPRKLLRTETANFRIELGSNGGVLEGLLPIDLRDARQVDDVLGLMEIVGYSFFVPAIRLSTNYRSEGPTTKRPGTHPMDEALLHEASHRTIHSAQHSTVNDDTIVRSNELHKRSRLIETDALSISDEAVMQKIVDLDYRAYRRDEPLIRGIVDTMVAIAAEVTEGYPIHFIRVDEDENGLFPQFNTQDGDLPFNVLSQGTQSLVQWLAALVIGMAEYYDYPEDIEHKHGILIVDEIDAHLHPSWQRRIIPTLTNHFPNLQILCSTHSPLMLAGLKEGQVHLLDRDNEGKVTVSRNERDIFGWSANEVLQSFLNIPNPTDLETAHNIKLLQELRRIHRPTEEQTKELERLRETVGNDLIGGPLSRDLEELRTILNEAKSRYDPAPPSD